MSVIDAAPECARELAAQTDADRVADLVFDEILTAVFSDRAGDREFVEALGQSVRDNVRAIIHLFAGRLELENAIPVGALLFADMSAELGIAVSELERAYWVGVARFWREWFEICERHAAETGDSLSDLVREPTALLFAYIDHILDSVVSRYDATRTDMIRTREHLRRALLARILEGSDDSGGPELEDALGYPLRGAHLAMVIEPAERRRVESELAILQRAAGASATLLLQRGARRWIAWIALPEGFEPGAMLALRRALEQNGSRIAVGEPAVGIAGMRQSHDQALMAASVQRALEPRSERALFYGDVRLEALLLADERRARQFVLEELGPLAADDPRMQRIRDTLLAWLSTGTHVGAAAQLGLHENTVRNRIRQAEEMLPGVLTKRRTEIQVALRIERVLGASERPVPLPSAAPARVPVPAAH